MVRVKRHSWTRSAKTPRPRCRALRRDVPADLETVCRKCLEKNPRDRYQTPSELANELRRTRRELAHAGEAGTAVEACRQADPASTTSHGARGPGAARTPVAGGLWELAPGDEARFCCSEPGPPS